MGFFKKLFGTGATVGATIAGVKVYEKYKQNNPNGVGDVNEDGVVDYKDQAIELKKATKEVAKDAAKYVKEKSPETYEKVKNTAGKAKAAAKKADQYVKDNAPATYEAAKKAAGKAKVGAKKVAAKAKTSAKKVADDLSK